MKRGINFIMKKSIRSLALLGVCALSLTACGEVKFADFKTAAETAVAKKVEYTTAKTSGSFTTKSDNSNSNQKLDFSFSYKTVLGTSAWIADDTSDAYSVLVALLLNNGKAALTEAAATENSSYKYYNLGVSYEEKDSDGNSISHENKWNDVGLFTKVVGNYTLGTAKGKISISVSYSK